MNPGSEAFRVHLQRDGPHQPWGFRLQGGTDFTTALSIQSVNPGSIAEREGLQAGDAVLQINNRPSDELEHEQAKQEIMASGNEVYLIVQRGAVKIWKPKVTPLSELRPKEMNLNQDSSTTGGEVYIQKTSLAADKPEVHHIGSGYNRTAKPFGASGFGGGSSGGGGGSVPAVVNAQYNSPIGMYSAENAVNTYQAQSAVLTGKMQGADAYHQPASSVSSSAGNTETRPPGIRSVKAPVYDPNQHEIQQAQHMTCKVCGSLIIGVFVRIKGEPLHPECFKCCRCGKNLKNQGYFHIEGQMYCEVHAKEASRPESGQGMYAVPIFR